jgi:hypothetical protein
MSLLRIPLVRRGCGQAAVATRRNLRRTLMASKDRPRSARVRPTSNAVAQRGPIRRSARFPLRRASRCCGSQCNAQAASFHSEPQLQCWQEAAPSPPANSRPNERDSCEPEPGSHHFPQATTWGRCNYRTASRSFRNDNSSTIFQASPSLRDRFRLRPAEVPSTAWPSRDRLDGRVRRREGPYSHHRART